jgi:hypothetical protein
LFATSKIYFKYRLTKSQQSNVSAVRQQLRLYIVYLPEPAGKSYHFWPVSANLTKGYVVPFILSPKPPQDAPCLETGGILRRSAVCEAWAAGISKPDDNIVQ